MNLSTAFSSIDLLKMSIKMRLMYWVLLYYCYLDLFWLFFFDYDVCIGSCYFYYCLILLHDIYSLMNC